MNTNSLVGLRGDTHTPVTIVTGFLGSGKTTLLNRVLRDPTMARAVIVINEFGEISIDHALTEASNDSIVVLENGCLCCTVFGDLVQTFNRLYHAREAGEIDFDHVIVETSGLAEPSPVIQAFLSDPTLEGLFRVATVVTTVDAVTGSRALDQHAVSEAQVAVADWILITKLDLVANDRRAATRASVVAKLRRLNRAAQIEATDDPTVDIVGLMRRANADPRQSPEAAKRWLEATLNPGADDEHVHSSHEGPEHDHDASIASFNLIREEPIPREALQLLLTSLEHHLSQRLLRVKGLINVAEEPDQPAVIQGVQHLLPNLSWLPRWPDADRRTRIVFITQGIAPEDLSEMVNLLERIAQRTAAARARANPSIAS